jgi:hypothetical protein
MAGDNYGTFRQVVWKRRIPETVLDLYFNHIRAFAEWKHSFPHFLHPAIRDVVQLEHNKTKVITDRGEYVFAFNEWSTFVGEAGGHVQTGTLEVYYSAARVLRLTISPPDSKTTGSGWTLRGVGDVQEGDWIVELMTLTPELEAHEKEQKRKEEGSQQTAIQGASDLQSKLASSHSESRSSKKSLIRRVIHRLVFLMLLILFVAALPDWSYSNGWNYAPRAGLGTALLIMLVLVLSGRI